MKKIILSLALCLSFVCGGIQVLSFSDIENSRFKDSIEYIKKYKLVNGYGDDTYRPSQLISRAEFMKIVLLAKYSPLDIYSCEEYKFKDYIPNSWYNNYICFAYKHDIVNGYSNGTFQPNKNISYAEASKIIVNTLITSLPEKEGKDWWKPFSNILMEYNAIPDTIENSYQYITRGEMAYMIHYTHNNINKKNMDLITSDNLNITADVVEEANELGNQSLTINIPISSLKGDYNNIKGLEENNFKIVEGGDGSLCKEDYCLQGQLNIEKDGNVVSLIEKPESDLGCEISFYKGFNDIEQAKITITDPEKYTLMEDTDFKSDEEKICYNFWKQISILK